MRMKISGTGRNTPTISTTAVGGTGNVRKYLMILDKDDSVWAILTKHESEIYRGKQMAKKVKTPTLMDTWETDR
jgi:hypothetical protein